MNDIQILEQINATQRQLKDIYIPERQSQIVTPFQSLPGLVGLWYPGNFQRSTGNIYDFSGQGRTLTYTGTPTIEYLTNGTAYADVDGTGDYWVRLDETDLDIQGNETVPGVPGLTFYCWLNPQSTGTYRQVLGKADDPNGPYRLSQTAGDDSQFSVRNSADTTSYAVSITDGFLTSEWAFYACRYIPSTELKIWRNIETNTNVVTIPAALLNGTDNFGFGGEGDGGNLWIGYLSICGLYSIAHSDAMVQSVFQRTRALFNI